MASPVEQSLALTSPEAATNAMTPATQHSLQIYPPPTDLVSEFWRGKYEKDAKKYWDMFYKRNCDKFFKDRHYLHKEWGSYFQRLTASADGSVESSGDANEKHAILEIGCGVGNTLFPLLETYPNLFVHACDFSPRAVNLVKTHKDYSEKRIHAFVCDVTCEDLTSFLSANSVDVATLVFCLSAISPEKMPEVLKNIKGVLKSNGRVLIRDYASGDLAQERLSNKVQKISENFYVRGDGTRAFYFTEQGLIDLFKEQGYSCEIVKVYEKSVENRAKELIMDRRWIQGVFCPVDALDNKPGCEEIDLSEGLASNMFGVPVLDVIPVILDGQTFQIKTLSKEYQHSCKATGLMLWESAQVLATLLARNRSALACKVVLELGCGSVGICSMVAASVAELVVATDGDADALALLAENLEANIEKTSSNICIEPLYWGCMQQIEVVKKQTDGRGYDLIIGSDVTYVAEAVPLLFATAKALIAKARPGEPEPLLLLCHIERHVNEASILHAAEECGFVLEARWPPQDDTPVTSRSLSLIRSMFPCGLEEAFESHALVRLFCFRRALQERS